jgi:hypothetical protein
LNSFENSEGDISQRGVVIGHLDHEIGGFLGVGAAAEGLEHRSALLGVPNGLRDLGVGFVHHGFLFPPFALVALDLPADGGALLDGANPEKMTLVERQARDLAGALHTTILSKISVALGNDLFSLEQINRLVKGHKNGAKRRTPPSF